MNLGCINDDYPKKTLWTINAKKMLYCLREGIIFWGYKFKNVEDSNTSLTQMGKIVVQKLQKKDIPRQNFWKFEKIKQQNCIKNDVLFINGSVSFIWPVSDGWLISQRLLKFLKDVVSVLHDTTLNSGLNSLYLCSGGQWCESCVYPRNISEKVRDQRPGNYSDSSSPEVLSAYNLAIHMSAEEL